jgi:DNA-binding NtrC family response regulator
MEYGPLNGSRPTLKAMLEAYERRIIEEALQASRGNQRRAARALGVLPTTLHEKMKRLGLLQRAGGDEAPSPSPEASAFVA